MPFKPERFKKHFKETMGTDCYLREIDEYRNTQTPQQKADLIRATMQIVEETIGEDNLQMIMQKCGMDCIGQRQPLLKKAKELYEESASMHSFLEKLNAHHIGGGHLALNGKSVDASYTTCYCESVKTTQETISANYCYCSTGWYKKLFEHVLQQNVRVELIQSIIHGADCCTFRIHI